MLRPNPTSTFMSVPTEAAGWVGVEPVLPHRCGAGYMALINQQAVANGNPLLGFVNLTIYRLGLGSGYAAEFHDITSGNDDG